MVEAQINDPDIGLILQAKIDHTARPSWSEISSKGPVTKTYWGEWDRLEVRNNQMYRLLYIFCLIKSVVY